MSNIEKTPNEIAVELIRAAKASGQDWLDLGDLGLETLPAELGTLVKHRCYAVALHFSFAPAPFVA